MIKKNVLLLIAAVLLTSGCMFGENETCGEGEYSGGYEVVEYTSDEVSGKFYCNEEMLIINSPSGGYDAAFWDEEDEKAMVLCFKRID